MTGDKLKALYLISDVGSFYAEPVTDGVIGEGLLYNDYMFHFEGNPERTVIVLKDSEKYITDAIKGWLGNHTEPSFITNNNNSFSALGSIAGILIFKEKITKWNYFGILLAMVSIIFITLSQIM